MLIVNRIRVEIIFSRGCRPFPSVFLKKMKARPQLNKNKKIKGSSLQQFKKQQEQINTKIHCRVRV